MPVDPQQAPTRSQQATTPPPQTATVGQLDALSYTQLKSRQSELLKQRSSLSSRRSDISGTYERATGTNRDGIGDRLAVMDKSMVQIESDLAAVGQAMVPKAPMTSTQSPPPNNQRSGPNGGDVVAAGVVVFLATMLIAVPAAVRRAKRRWLRESPNPGTATIGVGKERLDRIEQAVDTIAVEIERVSENQRFMTRLMTETQLAGSIAAVRGSTEMARAAAEEPRRA